MKYIIPALLALFLTGACTTDFELEGEWKDIPIVYAFLSIQDTAHYVRVNKAFLEPGGNALEIAQVTDSIYHDDLTVQLEKVATGEVFNMERVDGNEEGYVKEEGVFANDPNILYKLPAGEGSINLESEDEVRLILIRASDPEPITAEISMAGVIDSVGTSSPALDINQWRYDRTVNFGWESASNNRIFDLRVIINYREFPGTNPDAQEDKTLEWVINDAIVNEENENQETNRLVQRVRGQTFFNFVGQNIPVKEGFVRIFEDMDIYITGAGPELLEYRRVAQANTGITSAQSIPIYTNLSGDGLGVFTSRYQLIRPGIRLIGEAKDTLVNGMFTKDLNFK